MTRHKHADVLIAIAEGKAVQFKIAELGWKDYEVEYNHSPISSMGRNWEWRIKPEPKPDVVRYAGLTNSFGSCLSCLPQSSSNLKLIFDGETNELKSAEVLK